jgi:Ni/Co efflux regulator RcnB
MKRILLATVALAVLAAPASAFAQPSDWNKHHKVVRVDKKVVVHKDVTVHKKVVKRPRWRTGDRFPRGQHYVVVRDYQRYHLRRPPHGQHWVRVDNQYILVGITSGIISALRNAN